MKQFFFKAFIFVIPIVAFILYMPSLIDKGLIKIGYSGNYKEWEDIVNSNIKSEIIIQGSSRAWLHISPLVIDTSFHTSSYNLGMNGYPFLMQYYRFELYKLYNKQPKYIIQSLDPYLLSKKEDWLDLEQFIPYLKYEPIKEATSIYNWFTYKDYNFPFFKYLRCKNSIYYGMKGIFQKEQNSNGKFKGFKANDYKWDDSFKKFKRDKPNGYIQSMDSLTLSLFSNFLLYCNKNGIKVIFVYTPEYKEAQKLCLNRDSIMGIYKIFAANYGIPFLDYSDDSICNSTDNFYNSQHLNTKGVTIFNKIFVNDLRKIIDSVFLKNGPI